MSTGPGSLQRRILSALAAHPLSYDDLAVALFGEGCRESQRANMARAVRALAARGLVEQRPAWWWFPHLRVGLGVGLRSEDS